MSEATWVALRALFVKDYDSLRAKLARLTGSAELAEEALQDTYVRLERGGEIKDYLEGQQNYLFKMALNAARVILRKDRLRRRHIDLTDTLDVEIPDEAPGPEEIGQARADVRLMAEVMGKMPARRREIFVMAWFDDAPLQQIADRHGLTVRMVQIELKHAREAIAERLDRSNLLDFASRGSKALKR